MPAALRSLVATFVLALAFACSPPAQPDGGSGGGTASTGGGSGGGAGGGSENLDSGTVDAGKKDAGVPDAGPPDAGWVNRTAASWCNDRATAECWRDLRCLRIADAGFAECLKRRQQYCDQSAYTLGAQQGRLQFLSAQASLCLNGFDRGSCEDIPTACGQVFQGLVRPDGGCVLSDECDDTGYCYQYDGRCPHRCRPYLALGQSCDGFSLLCKPDEGFCTPDDAGVRRCAPLKGTGEACPAYDACRVDLTCIGGTCVKRQAQPGESCGEKSGFPYCTAEYFCRQNTSTTPPAPGTCQRKGGFGAVCSAGQGCLPSLRCASTFQTSTCTTLGGVGEPCGSFNECQDGLHCSPFSSRCESLPRDGGDCTSKGSYFECAQDFFCNFDEPNGKYACRARRQLGESCTYDQVCLTNECEFGPLADGGYGGSCVRSCSERADGGF